MTAATVAVVSYANLIDAATAILTLPNATADQVHPISNLKKRGLGDYLQLVGDHDLMTIDVDFGAAKTFNFIAGLGLGMLLESGAGSTIIWWSTSADGITYTTPVPSQIGDLAPMYLPGVGYAVIPGGATARYLRVSLDWDAMLPMRIGRLWVDNALILEDSIDVDATFGFVDPGKLSETDGQQYVEQRKLRTKLVNVTFRSLTTLQMWGLDGVVGYDVPSINAMQFVAGTTGEVIILPIWGTDSTWPRRTGVYGHIVSPYSISRDLNADSWTASATVQEER